MKAVTRTAKGTRLTELNAQDMISGVFTITPSLPVRRRTRNTVTVKTLVKLVSNSASNIRLTAHFLYRIRQIRNFDSLFDLCPALYHVSGFSGFGPTSCHNDLVEGC